MNDMQMHKQIIKWNVKCKIIVNLPVVSWNLVVLAILWFL